MRVPGSISRTQMFRPSSKRLIPRVKRRVLPPSQRVAAADFSVTEQADLNSFAAAPAPSTTGLKIASWALDGFGPTKLANPAAKQNGRSCRAAVRCDCPSANRIH